MIFRLLTFIFILSPLASGAQILIPHLSYVSFSVENMKIRRVDGELKGMSGQVKFNPENLEDSFFDVCVDGRTIDTDNKTRNSYIKRSDFFDVVSFPKICFTSKEVYATGRGHVAKGRLSLNGVTKTVEIPFTFEDQIFRGRFAINRFDFDIGDKYSAFAVDDLVRVQIVAYTKYSLN